jgi:hypothetical protein
MGNAPKDNATMSKETTMPLFFGRRAFLKAGTLGVAGLTLADVLRLRALAGDQSRDKQTAVIMLMLTGGPSHIDIFDLKPGAPVDIRGEFKPIRTSVPGLDICEHLPLLAKSADKLAVIRNMHFYGDHYGTELMSGFARPFERATAKQLRPVFGSVVSKLRGCETVPPYVSLLADKHHFIQDEDPVYLGTAHRPFYPSDGPGLANLSLHKDVTLERLSERRELHKAFDNLRRDLDEDALTTRDTHMAKALDILTANKARQAFDLSREPQTVRDNYGKTPLGQWLLQARRLVEAGVSVVTVGHRDWDSHAANFIALRRNLPLIDHVVSALIGDLYERGLDKNVLVIVWGEMGRTPIINKNQGGRDHWPLGFALLAGGGLKMGQVIGATDSRAWHPKGSVYTAQNLLATAYQLLGIDLETTFLDHTGRPVYLLDDRRSITELA